MEKQWFYVIGDKTEGPVSETDLKEIQARGEISEDSLIWAEGMDSWAPFSSLGKTLHKSNHNAEPDKDLSVVPQIVVGEDVSYSKMFCSNCGKELDDELVFCKNCGSRIVRDLEEDKHIPNNKPISSSETYPKQPVVQSSVKKSNLGKWISVVSIVCIVLVVIVVFILNAVRHEFNESQVNNERREKEKISNQGQQSEEISTAVPANTLTTVPPQLSNEEIITQARKAIDNYLFVATNNRNLETLLSFYSDEVNYYSSGIVNKDFIRNDKEAYYKRWTSVRTAIVGEPKIDIQENDIISVKFSTNWMVQNSRKTIYGTADNLWKFRKTSDGLKIIDEKQNVTSRNR